MMNEEMEQFERRLSRQPLRQIPTEWRGELLSAAKHASRPVPRTLFLSTFNHQLSTLLWPHPKAWAGLAVVWILIFAVDFSMHDKLPVVTEKAAPPSPEVIVELKQQRRIAGGIDWRESGARRRNAKIFTIAAKRARGDFDDLI